MDPNACIELIKQHIGEGNYEEAFHSLCDLRDWIQSGGFTDNGILHAAWNLNRCVLEHAAGALGWEVA